MRWNIPFSRRETEGGMRSISKEVTTIGDLPCTANGPAAASCLYLSFALSFAFWRNTDSFSFCVMASEYLEAFIVSAG